MPAVFRGTTHVTDMQNTLQKKSNLSKIACLQQAHDMQVGLSEKDQDSYFWEATNQRI